jgi:thiol-disulfide isomerase/thioredoxin
MVRKPGMALLKSKQRRKTDTCPDQLCNKQTDLNIFINSIHDLNPYKMKAFLIFVTLMGILISGCLKKEDSEPEINYDGSTYIKLIAENIIDSITFEDSFLSYFTNLPQRKKVLIQKDGIYILEIPMILPELVDLVINDKDSLKTYLIPGDTLTINLKQESSDSEHCYTSYIVNDNIFNYCQSRYKYFGYHKILDGPARGKWLRKIVTSQKLYNTVIAEADSVEKQNILFLNENSKGLPNWFVTMEKNNITYVIAHLKIIFFESLTNYQKKDSTISVPIYNPEARLSFEYYRFLDKYFRHGQPLEKNLSGTRLVISLIDKEFHNIDSILNGEIKSVYLDWNIAQLYTFCRSDEDASLVDTFMKSHDTYIKEDGVKYINQQKEYSYNRRVDLASLKPGDGAPNFELKDMSGEKYSFSDFNGKIIYLHFWATWCGPCIGEIPLLNKLITDVNNDKIVFINVCLDNDSTKWKAIISEKKLLGVNLICDDNWSKKLNSLYKISEIPHYTLIDENGLIIRNNCVRPGNVTTEISQLLDKK